MSGGIKQISLVCVFAGLLGSVFFFRDYLSGTAETERLDREAALARYGFCLEEVAGQCGLNFTHRAPTLDPKLSHIMPIIANGRAKIECSNLIISR